MQPVSGAHRIEEVPTKRIDAGAKLGEAEVMAEAGQVSLGDQARERAGGCAGDPKPRGSPRAAERTLPGGAGMIIIAGAMHWFRPATGSTGERPDSRGARAR